MRPTAESDGHAADRPGRYPLVAKGSPFLTCMTNLSDGLSFVLEVNPNHSEGKRDAWREKVIPFGDGQEVKGESLKKCLEVAGAQVVLVRDACFVWTAALALDSASQGEIRKAAEIHGPENLIVVWGVTNEQYLEVGSRTIMEGDPSWSAPWREWVFTWRCSMSSSRKSGIVSRRMCMTRSWCFWSLRSATKRSGKRSPWWRGSALSR